MAGSVTFIVNFIHPCEEKNAGYFATLKCDDCGYRIVHRCHKSPVECEACPLIENFYRDFGDVLHHSHLAAQRNVNIAARYTVFGDNAVVRKLFKPGLLDSDGAMVGVMLDDSPLYISEIEKFPTRFVQKHTRDRQK